MTPLRFAFYTASSPGDGSGHVTRNLALADVFKLQGHESVFFLSAQAGALQDVVITHGHQVRLLKTFDLQETGDSLRNELFTGLVVDGYRFSDEMLSAWAGIVPLRLVFDDLLKGTSAPASYVLNQNIGASKADYAKRLAPGTQLLLGPTYALLRKEFLNLKSLLIRDKAIHVLVTIGGEDPENATALILEALNSLKDRRLEITIVLGPRYRFRDSLQRLLQETPHHCECLDNVSAMAPLMERADVGITAAGSTIWEFMVCGLPFITFASAENQQALAKTLGQEKRGVVLDHLKLSKLATALAELLDSKKTRQEFSDRGRTLVDGRGALRVAAAVSGVREVASR
jgi:UDP-2,4-diacetamido-2,4,6-trideoxy-beta-L-altropyranose hydrolase